MISVELTPEERDLLAEVLRSYLASLEVEIGHTDHRDFKVLLKHRRALLTGLLQKVQGIPQTEIA